MTEIPIKRILTVGIKLLTLTISAIINDPKLRMHLKMYAFGETHMRRKHMIKANVY